MKATGAIRWIPVAESLPFAGTWVLCWCDSIYVIARCLDEIWVSNEGEFLDPTHWMPLPEPPT